MKMMLSRQNDHLKEKPNKIPRVESVVEIPFRHNMVFQDVVRYKIAFTSSQ